VFVLGFTLVLVQSSALPILDGLGKVQGILAALIALLGGGAGLYGVKLQIAHTAQQKRDDQVANSEALLSLLNEQLTSTAFALEYQAEYASKVTITSTRAHILTAINNNKLLADLSSAAVKRAWEELPRCHAENRLQIAHLIGILDKFSKQCENTALAFDMLKDYQPKPGEMTHTEFVIHQRDMFMDILRAEGLYSDGLKEVHDRAVQRVQEYLERFPQMARPA
jgi:hypothetical protein